MKLSFPDKYCDTIMLIAEPEGASLDNLTSGFDEDTPKTIRVAEVISDEPAEDDYMEMLNEMYGDFQIISDYIEQNNKENIDFEKLDEFLSNVSNTSDVKLYFNISSIRNVICLLEFEDENGEKNTYEQDFIMYYIDGEGWKTDLSMLSYIKKSKQAGINSTASSIMKASNSATIELDEIGVEFPEKCIICSDKSQNYNVSNDFVNQFEEKLGYFFSDYNKVDYIIVIDKGICVYTACTDSESLKYIGTYPAERLYSADDEYIPKKTTHLRTYISHALTKFRTDKLKIYNKKADTLFIMYQLLFL